MQPERDSFFISWCKGVVCLALLFGYITLCVWWKPLGFISLFAMISLLVGLVIHDNQ